MMADDLQSESRMSQSKSNVLDQEVVAGESETNHELCLTPEVVPEVTVGGFKMLQLSETERMLDSYSVDEFHVDKIPIDTEIEATNVDSFHTLHETAGTRTQKQVGRIPYYKKYPALVNVVTEFLESTGFQAQLRQRTEVGVALGREQC